MNRIKGLLFLDERVLADYLEDMVIIETDIPLIEQDPIILIIKQYQPVTGGKEFQLAARFIGDLSQILTAVHPDLISMLAAGGQPSQRD
jgi:hypothetical protein